ncbi:hypothetical protein GGI00_000684 [Coemansia sp. RSA 2681]|nr:hypothetical protein GGI00_000684 [Coemansia sp. RSA 2681]KAJ2457651.1 hypothetical protein GGF42_002548 [Coemansia sp. RSA 2424]
MLKQITNVRVSFCPFSKSTTSTKVFLNRVLSKENSTANPSCKIDIVTTNFAKDPSTIDVTFKDGKKFHISSGGGGKMSGDDIIAQVQKYSKRLSQQEDLKSQ